MNLDPFVLLIVILGTAIIGVFSVMLAWGTWQRLLLIGMFIGLFIYSGVGAAFPEVPNSYLFYYFGFLFVFAAAFLFFKTVFIRLSIRSGLLMPRVFEHVDRHPIWLVVLWVYVLTYFVPFVYPILRLQQLFNPVPPDLLTAWAALWEPKQTNIILKLFDYIRVTLTPFFYIALFRFRYKMSIVLLIFAVLLYVQYVDGSYIGRSTIAVALATIWLSYWISRPVYRRVLITLTIVGAPFLLISSYYYGVYRIGGSPDFVMPFATAFKALETEISFPRDIGVSIFELGARVDLNAYFKWVFTLPIPKLLTGEIGGARLNYEISELIIGLSRGVGGWYVVLPGLVVESVYIYGRQFFWLHAVFIAFVAAFLVRLLERTPQFLFLQAYVVVTFAFHMNRGGISGPLAIFVNEFMLFYILVFALMFGFFKAKKPNMVIKWQKRGTGDT